MPFNNKKKHVFMAAIALFGISAHAVAEGTIVDLAFATPPDSGSDTARTLQSIVRVRDISEAYATGGLYLITHVGAREELFRKENQAMIDNPLFNQTWRFCSVFSIRPDSAVIVGRNWDNQNAGSIIISLYRPPDGYSSISFSRAIDLGFPCNVRLDEIAGSPFGEKLLLAPFYAMDGVNEHGLTVAVAGVRQTTHSHGSEAQPVYVTLLIRRILDHARNIEEAMSIAEKHVPFDLDRYSLNGHYLVADSWGRSVILEYEHDQWRMITSTAPWQVLTTKSVYNVPDMDLRAACWRYRSISETLERSGGDVDWNAGMHILQDVTQNGTTWSVIYAPTTEDIYFAVYQDWETIYHIETP